jgi:hypothetical protein
LPATKKPRTAGLFYYDARNVNPGKTMTSKSRLILQLSLLALWMAASYGVRFYLMENVDWLEICDRTPARIECGLRSGLGLTIHFGILSWGAIALAIPAFFIKGNAGRALAWIALLFAVPALALYTVTMAAFALLLCALRLIRDERQSAAVSNIQAPAQPSA